MFSWFKRKPAAPDVALHTGMPRTSIVDAPHRKPRADAPRFFPLYSAQELESTKSLPPFDVSSLYKDGKKSDAASSDVNASGAAVPGDEDVMKMAGANDLIADADVDVEDAEATDVAASPNTLAQESKNSAAEWCETSASSEEAMAQAEREKHIHDPEVVQKEVAAIQEMRRLLALPPSDDRSQDSLRTDLDLRRFIRARKYDIDAAVAQYKDTLAFREEYGVATMFDEECPHEACFQCICPHRNHGFDAEGHPVYLERTGLVRMGVLLKHMTEDHVVRRRVRHLEYLLSRCEYQSALQQRNVERFVFVHDLAGMSYKAEPSGMRVFRRTLRISEHFYPERLHKMLLINAPLSFRGIWAAIKPWLDPNTTAKIEIWGSNYQPRMKELLCEEQLPIMYGGTCVCRYDNGDSCLPVVRHFEPGKPPADTPPAWVVM